MEIQTYGMEPAWQFNLAIGTCVRVVKSVSNNFSNLKSDIDVMIANHMRKYGYVDGIVTRYVEGQQTICVSVFIPNPLINDSLSMLPSIKEMTMTLRIADFTNNELQFVELVPNSNNE